MIAVALYGVTAGLAMISACMLWLYAKDNRDAKGIKGLKVSAICLAAIAAAQTALVVMTLCEPEATCALVSGGAVKLRARPVVEGVVCVNE